MPATWLRGLKSKLCFCVPKNKLAHAPETRIHGKKIARNSPFLILFFMGKSNKKTRQIHFRVTEKEYELIQKKASSYKNLSSFFVRMTYKFNDKYDIKSIEVMEATGSAFTKWKQDLDNFSRNINAIANYCNRCELLGIDDFDPIIETRKYINQMNEFFKDINAFHIRFLTFIGRYRAH